MEPKELESVVKTAMVKAFIDELPEDTRNYILAASIERTFDEVYCAHSMRLQIEEQYKAYAYMLEYLKTPEVQERLKAKTCKTLDILNAAVLHSIIIYVQRNMKSEYFGFVKDRGGD